MRLYRKEGKDQGKGTMRRPKARSKNKLVEAKPKVRARRTSEQPKNPNGTRKGTFNENSTDYGRKARKVDILVMREGKTSAKQ